MNLHTIIWFRPPSKYCDRKLPFAGGKQNDYTLIRVNHIVRW